MEKPKVSLLWINYNSSRILSYILDSLKSMLNQDYSNYEIIVLDNNSTDGSWEKIKEYLLSSAYELIKKGIVKLVRSPMNIGYNDGVNLAYLYSDPRSRYVTIINNDAKLSTDYISYQVDFLEKNRSCGAVQGIILKWSSNVIDSTGFYIDKELIFYPIHRVVDINSYDYVVVSHVEGTTPFYRVEALRKSMTGRYIFLPETFIQWFDGVFVGRMLWRRGYKSVLLTQVLARHRREATVGQIKKVSPVFGYFKTRNKLAFILLSDIPGKYYLVLKILRRTLYHGSIPRKYVLRAFCDAFSFSRRAKRKYRLRIEVFHGPLVVRIGRELRVVFYK